MKILAAAGRRWGKTSGVTLIEGVVSLAIAGVMVSGLVSGFYQAVQSAELAAYSLAGNSMAVQGLEQVRAAKWDPVAYPPVDNVVNSNFPVRVEVLDIPVTKSNIVYATNRFYISTVSTAPPLKLIRVECTWKFHRKGLYTNVACTYRAPDQ